MLLFDANMLEFYEYRFFLSDFKMNSNIHTNTSIKRSRIENEYESEKKNDNNRIMNGR